jgi:hypothetical protein
LSVAVIKELQKEMRSGQGGIIIFLLLITTKSLDKIHKTNDERLRVEERK